PAGRAGAAAGGVLRVVAAVGPARTRHRRTSWHACAGAAAQQHHPVQPAGIRRGLRLPRRPAYAACRDRTGADLALSHVAGATEEGAGDRAFFVYALAAT